MNGERSRGDSLSIRRRPITVAGLVGSSQVYQTDVNSATVGKTVAQANFNPCIPASAVNTAITVTTTTNGTATAVDVNSWGYQQQNFTEDFWRRPSIGG